MSGFELFLVLLALAFIGGVRVVRDSGSRFGLASGVEYLVLGVILGPRFLGLVGKGAVHEFEALLLMGIGWLLAVWGINFGTSGGAKFGFFRLLLPIAASAACALSIFFVTRYVAWSFRIPDATLVALGLAAVGTESAWRGMDPKGAEGRALWFTGSELVPILLLGAMVWGKPLFASPITSELQGVLLNTGLGFVLGAVVSSLIAAHFELAEVWPLLLGSILLVVGTALRLDLPAASPAFILGLTVAVLSRHRDELRALMNTTEHQLLLPCLLLAGVVFEWPGTAGEWALVAVCLGARFAFKLLQGLILYLVDRQGEGVFTAGRRLLHASGFSIALGLVVFMRELGDVGQVVLTAAVLNVLVGEIFVPRQKRERTPAVDPESAADEGAPPSQQAPQGHASAAHEPSQLPAKLEGEAT